MTNYLNELKKAQGTSPSNMPSKLWTKDLLQSFSFSHNAETNHPFFPPSLQQTLSLATNQRLTMYFGNSTRFSPKKKMLKLDYFNMLKIQVNKSPLCSYFLPELNGKRDFINVCPVTRKRETLYIVWWFSLAKWHSHVFIPL